MNGYTSKNAATRMYLEPSALLFIELIAVVWIARYDLDCRLKLQEMAIPF